MIGGAVAHAGQDVGVGAVDEGVADGQVEGERWGGLQRREAGRLEGGDGQAEAGDGDGEGVEVDAVDRVEGGLDAGLEFQAGGVAVPAVEQTVEGAEQEVAGAAGGVDEPEAFERTFFQRWFEGAVEDELLDEDRRLQQRVGVLGVLGEVLVQVAEEPGGQRGVGQVVDERAVLAAAAPEVEQPGHRVTGRRDQVQRGVRVDQRLRRGQPGQVVDRDLQPFAVGVLGVGAEERRAGRRVLPDDGSPGRRSTPGCTSALSSQNRMNTLVSTHATAAWVIRSSRQATQDAAVRSFSRARWCSCFQCPSRSASACEPGAQVVFQEQDLPLQIGGEGCGRGHDAPSAAETVGRESIHSASRRKNWPGAASGSGRLSMMAPWVPDSCGTSTQIACGRRAARSVHRLEHGQVPVPGQRRESR